MDRNDLITEIKKQLQEELNYYKNSLEEKIPDEQMAQAKKAKSTAETFVRENPWSSIAMATLVGFVIARYLYKRGDE